MENKKLNIAVFITAFVPTSAKNTSKSIFAPVEVGLNIGEGLSKKGHKVTFFGPIGSESKISTIQQINQDPDYKNKILLLVGKDETKKIERIKSLLDQHIISEMFKNNQTNNYDLIHVHDPDRTLPFASLTQTSIVYTIHSQILPWQKEIYKFYKSENQHFVAISNFQKKTAPKINWAGVIYNGINLNNFKFEERGKNYLFSAGRIIEKKGVHTAIKVALKTGKKLNIVGDRSEKKFWEEKIKPHLKERNITFKGFLGSKKMHDLYRNAKTFIFPIECEESFGLVMAESMACGTPVIAFAKGSVPEVIKDGQTGFIVNSSPSDIRGNWIIKKTGVEGLCEAVEKIYSMPEGEYLQMRKNCRKHVEENFSIEKMVDNYEKVYYEILKKKK